MNHDTYMLPRAAKTLKVNSGQHRFRKALSLIVNI